MGVSDTSEWQSVSSPVALLVMDIQNATIERLHEGSDVLLAKLDMVTTAARAASVPVIYVRLLFRRGYPEISGNNKTFSAVASSGRIGPDDPAADIHQAVTPQPGDIVVTKKRVSAFVGSDLEVVLRSLKVSSLVLTGIWTSGVVLSTLRQAADLDYEISVLRDGCADIDLEAHGVLLDKVFPRQATVLSIDEWIKGLNDK